MKTLHHIFYTLIIVQTLNLCAGDEKRTGEEHFSIPYIELQQTDKSKPEEKLVLEVTPAAPSIPQPQQQSRCTRKKVIATGMAIMAAVGIGVGVGVATYQAPAPMPPPVPKPEGFKLPEAEGGYCKCYYIKQEHRGHEFIHETIFEPTCSLVNITSELAKDCLVHANVKSGEYGAYWCSADYKYRRAINRRPCYTDEQVKEWLPKYCAYKFKGWRSIPRKTQDNMNNTGRRLMNSSTRKHLRRIVARNVTV